VVTASPAAMRAAAMRRATTMRSPQREMWGPAAVRPAAMRAAHREMWCSTAMRRTAAVKCRTTVERGRASV
jgi:hypothetical protein